MVRTATRIKSAAVCAGNTMPEFRSGCEISSRATCSRSFVDRMPRRLPHSSTTGTAEISCASKVRCTSMRAVSGRTEMSVRLMKSRTGAVH